MNVSDCPAPADALAEIEGFVEYAFERLPSTNLSAWDILNYLGALALAMSGLVLAPVAGPYSLFLSMLGVVWLLVDIFRKVMETAKTDEEKRDAESKVERLRFLQWCLRQVI